MKFDLQPPEPVLVADLFPEILHALLELFAGLSTADWEKATVCPGWSVKDVALHLLGGEIGNLSRRRDGHALGASMRSWDDLVTAINEWNRDWVKAARRISPRLLIDLMEFTGIQMNDYFCSLGPFALGGPVSWVGPEPAPVWLDIAREYTERWHHQQHIRDAVDRPGLKEPRYFEPVLATFVRALPRAYRGTDAAEETSVTLTITGNAGGRWSLLREGRQWRLYAGGTEQPDAEVIVDQEIAWRLFTGGIGRDEAQEEMVFKGERELGLPVHEMVSIIA
jgi:uncharacterized protein (TIGR03083 family)